MYKQPFRGKFLHKGYQVFTLNFLHIGYKVFTHNFLKQIVIRSEDAVMCTKKFDFLSHSLLEVPTVTAVNVTSCF